VSAPDNPASAPPATEGPGATAPAGAIRRFVTTVNRLVDDEPALLRAAVTAACELVSVPHGALFVFDDQSQQLKLGHAEGADWRTEPPALDLALNAGVCARVLQTRVPALCNDVAHEADYQPLFAPAAAELAVPLRAGHRLIGVLALASPQANAFHHGATELLALFAGQIAAALETARRFTELRRDRDDWHDLFQVVPDGLLLCHADLTIARANAAFLKMFKRVARDITGRPVEDTFYRLSIFGSQTRFWKMLTRYGRFEQKFRSPSGRRSFHIRAARVQFRGRPAYVINLAETTHQDALHERALLSEKLDAVSKVVGSLAHQLNTPLQSVTALSELLAINPDHPDRAAKLRLLHEETRCAARVMKTLLLYSHGQAPERQSLSLNRTVEHAVHDWHQHAHTDGLRLDLKLLDEDVQVQGDSFQISHLLRSLLQQALKQAAHAPAPRGPRIGVSLTRQTQAVRLTVGHNGTGPFSLRPGQMFEAAFGRDPRGQETGLELALCRRIADQHGGRIWWEPGASGGASFHVELPAPPVAPAPAPTAARAPGASPASGRLLIVDDEPNFGFLLRELLSAQNIQAEFTTDARDALLKLESDHFDWILCDLRMPKMSGEAFYAELSRTRPEMARRIIFATGDMPSKYPSLFQGARRPEILIKPFRTEQLLECMKARPAAA
jgi:signal transduction histidine kinase/CheY-like chemotaxis protein